LDEETLALLGEADWGMLHRELLTYATWRAKNYRWRRGEGLELAAGMTVEDVVQEVVVKALSGIRKWDPARGQLLPWLQAQSRSIIDALARSAPHRREVNTLEVENFAVVQSPSSLAIVLEKEAQAQMEQKVNALLLAADGEPELREVLRVIMGGCEPRPRHIAAELGVSVKDINNRLKRLRRCASKL
jgi:RNA polymerase sigma factor (sigma-70 family)